MAPITPNDLLNVAHQVAPMAVLERGGSLARGLIHDVSEHGRRLREAVKTAAKIYHTHEDLKGAHKDIKTFIGDLADAHTHADGGIIDEPFETLGHLLHSQINLRAPKPDDDVISEGEDDLAGGSRASRARRRKRIHHRAARRWDKFTQHGHHVVKAIEHGGQMAIQAVEMAEDGLDKVDEASKKLEKGKAKLDALGERLGVGAADEELEGGNRASRRRRRHRIERRRKHRLHKFTSGFNKTFDKDFQRGFAKGWNGTFDVVNQVLDPVERIVGLGGGARGGESSDDYSDNELEGGNRASRRRRRHRIERRRKHRLHKFTGAVNKTFDKDFQRGFAKGWNGTFDTVNQVLDPVERIVGLGGKGRGSGGDPKIEQHGGSQIIDLRPMDLTDLNELFEDAGLEPEDHHFTPRPKGPILTGEYIFELAGGAVATDQEAFNRVAAELGAL